MNDKIVCAHVPIGLSIALHMSHKEEPAIQVYLEHGGRCTMFIGHSQILHTNKNPALAWDWELLVPGREQRKRLVRILDVAYRTL